MYEKKNKGELEQRAARLWCAGGVSLLVAVTKKGAKKKATNGNLLWGSGRRTGREGEGEERGGKGRGGGYLM
jgi:hypothetical protein